MILLQSNISQSMASVDGNVKLYIYTVNVYLYILTDLMIAVRKISMKTLLTKSVSK